MTDPGTPTDEVPVSLNLASYQKIFDRPSWHSMGACRSRPTKWWFSKIEAEVLAATVVCTTICPVRWKCLSDNLDVPQGIFGGFTAAQRRTIREEYSVLVSPELLQMIMEDEETG